ncbi:MAG TPA: chromosomal replication initiator protein DnaA [Candidatus Nanoarchaeia archaeon]|nr:chromosomal replication initiator protein DnaA [Candidatus Nanoarchaeia archaeon]
MMPDNKKLWDNVLVEMELSVSKPNFNTWFRDTSISKIDDGVVFVSVPNNFVKDWLHKKYHSTILKILRTTAPAIRSLEYTVSRGGEKKRAQTEERPAINTLLNNELPLSDFYINKEDNLNPRYGFDSFIVGPFNELAYAAAQAVVKKPGIVYNPLFVYGSTGHGKTHLIQAVGNYLKHMYPDMRIHYVTSEKFAGDYVSSVQSAQSNPHNSNKINNFKEKYRKYDVLIMDDIQFLSKTEKTQEELFHLFNHLYDNNKQIIFSSDKHPNYIPNLEDRLRSRFAAGMIVDIPAPDHESRIAILKAKLRSQEVILTDEIIDFIAASVSTNIRELEGVLNAVVCQAQLKGRELSLQEVKTLLKNSARPAKRTLSTKEVIKIVADFYNIEEASIYEKTRKKEVIRPRQVTMYILREDFKISYPSIGERLGGRDHTTVIHSCEKIKTDLKNDSALGQELNQIRALIT